MLLAPSVIRLINLLANEKHICFLAPSVNEFMNLIDTKEKLIRIVFNDCERIKNASWQQKCFKIRCTNCKKTFKLLLESVEITFCLLENVKCKQNNETCFTMFKNRSSYDSLLICFVKNVLSRTVYLLKQLLVKSNCLKHVADGDNNNCGCLSGKN